jgi:hypothetical protein
MQTRVQKARITAEILPPPAAEERRSEPRYEGLAERAIVLFRGQEHLVRVIDLSTRGTQVESDIVARLGENVSIRFEGCSRMQAFVRWSREGRIGLRFGHEIILGG